MFRCGAQSQAQVPNELLRQQSSRMRSVWINNKRRRRRKSTQLTARGTNSHVMMKGIKQLFESFYRLFERIFERINSSVSPKNVDQSLLGLTTEPREITVGCKTNEDTEYLVFSQTSKPTGFNPFLNIWKENKFQLQPFLTER